MQSWSDPFLYRATTSILHILILSSIQCPEALRHKAALRGGFQRPWQTKKKKKKNGFAHRVWIFSLHKIAFTFLNQTVGRSGLNLASRVTVGRCFTWFSRRPMICSLKHQSYNFSLVVCHFSGLGDWYSQLTVCQTLASKVTVSRCSPNSFYVTREWKTVSYCSVSDQATVGRLLSFDVAARQTSNKSELTRCTI